MGSWLLLGTDSLIAGLAIGIAVAYSIPGLRRNMWLANAVAGVLMIVGAGVVRAMG